MLWLAPGGRDRHACALHAARTIRRCRSGPDFDLTAFLAAERRTRTLEVNGIGIAFGGIKAATDVSFTAEPGKITSVIGPNGAGKTTVLNMIGGFYRPDSGQHPARRRRARRRAGLEGRARRHRAHLSDHASCSAP